ncbi:MAG: LysR family transcriptional regulator [Proteobacteria bacterium]|nr:LysR family transcriptional regulator [Burkholderiales bacterium]
MEPRDLEYFRVMADHGQLARAAEALGLSQPALTKSLQRLESDVGAQLFERTPRGVRLTPIGSALLARAAQVRLALDQARAEVADLAAGRVGRVRIGIGPTMVELLLPATCSRLLVEAPQVTLQVTTGLNDVLIDAVERGELDLVLSTLPEHRVSGMHYEPLLEDDLLVVARTGHRLARTRRRGLDQLLREGWVLPAPAVLSRQTLERAFIDAEGAVPRVVVETNSVALVFALVARTDLLGFHSRRALQASPVRAKLQAIEVPALRSQRRIGLIYRSDAYFPPAAKRLVTLLREVARSLA